MSSSAVESVVDVLIVGAGSSGCALAARLSEDPARSVTVLEAGPTYTSIDGVPNELLRADAMAGAVPGHPNNWSMLGQLTPGNTFPVARGKILGGSSAVNGTLFQRGTPEDFAAWSEVAGDAWSYEQVLPYYRRLETDHDFDDEFHGQDGPVPVRRQGGDLLSPISSAFIEAAEGLGYPADPDKNRPGAPGVGLLPMNVVDGVRVNAAMAYILPVLDRPNLTVQGNTLVRRVVIEDGRAVGVEVASDDGGTMVIRAREVVLSAGAVKSPQLLACSGIGPRAELERLGVPVVHEAAGVGKNFIDHPDVWVGYQLDRPIPHDSRRGVFQASLNLTASESASVGDLEILCRSSSLAAVMFGPGTTLWQFVRERLRHPRQSLAAFRGIPLRTIVQQIRQRHDYILFCGLQQGLSRGELRFTSSDSAEQPEIHYHYCSDPEDRRRMREVVRVAVSILQSAPFRALGATITAPVQADVDDDQALDAWIRSSLRTAFHTVGTCRMGPASDPASVVDERCCVHGVEGLRVVDVSIMPVITRRGTAATAIMIGERAAEFFDAGDADA